MSGVTELVRSLGHPVVVVVGDVMLDRYVFGSVSRVSPEAPIPVLRVMREEERPGGAASAANDLQGLEAQARLVGYVGRDAAGHALLHRLAEAGLGTDGIVEVDDRTTTLKTRLVAAGASHQNRQHVLRADQEDSSPYLPRDEERLLAAFDRALTGAHCVVISDYAKGVVSAYVSGEVIGRARAAGLPVVVDPKGDDYARYRGATVMKPNRGETERATGIRPSDPDSIGRAGRRLIERAGVDSVIISLDKDGMALVTPDGNVDVIPTSPREVFDVTGAGDVVVAALGIALADGRSLHQAMELANVAAGVSVGKIGAAPVSREEVLQAAGAGGARNVIVWPAAQLRVELDAARARGRSVVFTNGCFDILHAGHVRFLEAARREGDLLVVGLNSDASVARLKGPDRPVNPQADRAEVLLALACVDYVCIFEEDTPQEVISLLAPDVLVKGEDWRDKGVVGREVVERLGGRVVLVPLLPGRSTSGVVERIRGGNPASECG